MSYNEQANILVPFETFDPNVFVGNDEYPQCVCNLVLSLGLAYNDFRDVFFAKLLLNEVVVEKSVVPTVQLGLRNGIKNTLIRVQTGFVHELLNMIRDNRGVVDEPSFKHIVRALSKKGKSSWSSIYDVATNKPSDDALAKALLLIRNKVSFHYDAEQLGNGYLSAFIKEKTHGRPLLSRGSILRETRFYFADASTEAYIASKTNDSTTNDFLHGTGNFLESINQALYEIVTRFIQLRSPWIQFKTGA